MPNHDFRSVHLPYCIRKLPNGSYVVLNRDYKPIGFRTTRQVDCEAYPIGVKFKRLTVKTVAKLSCQASPDINNIYLYHDGSQPTANAKNMEEYLERIRVLAALKFEDK